jgi:transketolase
MNPQTENGQNKYSAIKKRCLSALLHLHKQANAGHIASSLSCLDILIWLFCGKMKNDDRCILSKGHAATALYVTLAETGKIPKEMLDSFHHDGTNLPVHPPCNGVIADIPFGTGSLGHGLPLATGLAFSQKWTNKTFNVYCVISDGDLNEGSTWEAILFAAQHHLSNLTVLIDYNRLQAFGYTKDVIDMEPLADKFRSFGFAVALAENGNSVDALEAAQGQFANIDDNQNKPRCIIAYTTKGAGISFMENKLEWHYLPMNEEQFEQAILEINSING